MSGIFIRVRGEIWVRDRVSVRTRGGLGFIYYYRIMLELKLHPSGIFRNKAGYTARQLWTVGKEQ